MAEKPILFSGPMVRAILDGKKTQTRRIVTDRNSTGNHRASELLLNDPRTFADPGPSPAGNAGPYLHAYINCEALCRRHGWDRSECDPQVMERLYPRYEPGDRLWVRETWAAWATVGAGDLWRVRYDADGKYDDFRLPTDSDWMPPKNLRVDRPTNAPSIFMPRWASRLTLEITEVRVEQLQEISEADAIAEGLRRESNRDGEFGWLPAHEGNWELSNYPRNAFALSWDQINASRGYGWDVNPFCWVLTFRRVGT